MDLRGPDGRPALRIAPAVQEVVQQSKLSPEAIRRVYGRLAVALSAPETVASLPRWREHADGLLHQILLGEGNGIHVFTFVLVPDPEQGMIVAGCEHYRTSAG
jgi:hypothetical protein